LVRLPNLSETDPAFIAAWVKAGKQELLRPSRATLGTVAAVIEAYRASETWRALAPGTRTARGRILDSIAQMGAKATLSTLKSSHVAADIKKYPRHAGRNRLKAWRGLLSFAIEDGLLMTNPSDDVARPKVPKSDGHTPWTDDECAAFRAHWQIGTQQRLAFELLLWTGARKSDGVTFGWPMVASDGWLTYTQSKTGDECSIPLTSPMSGWLSAFAEDQRLLLECLPKPQERQLWIVTQNGRPRGSNGFTNWFSAAAKDAGLVGRSAHGLRKTRAIRLVLAGATPHQVGAWTGHSSLSEIEHYTRGASRRLALIGSNGHPDVTDVRNSGGK